MGEVIAVSLPVTMPRQGPSRMAIALEVESCLYGMIAVAQCEGASLAVHLYYSHGYLFDLGLPIVLQPRVRSFRLG